MKTPISEDQVRAAMESVMDPELGASIVELGMLTSVEIGAKTITIGIALTTAGCPLKHQLKTDITTQIESLGATQSVRIEFGEMNQEQRSAVMDTARKVAQERAPMTMIPRRTRVIAVASGKGGVGKSSVTANLAASFALQGNRVGILDADIWGFSIPPMFGINDRLGGHDGMIDPNVVTVGTGAIEIVSMGFLVEDGSTALMWRGLMLAKAVEQFLTDVRWGDLDVLLIDLPPGTGDVQMALARLLPQTAVVVVTTPARIAQVVASRVADMARRSHLRVVGVIENMSAYIDEDGASHEIFGSGGGNELATQLGVPFLGSVPIEPEIARAGDGALPIAVTSPDSSGAKAIEAIAHLLDDALPHAAALASCTARIDDLLLSIQRGDTRLDPEAPDGGGGLSGSTALPEA
ncbi:MAG: P-loop NTPase [Acidimicrobiia bacterium]